MRIACRIGSAFFSLGFAADVASTEERKPLIFKHYNEIAEQVIPIQNGVTVMIVDLVKGNVSSFSKTMFA